MAESTSHHRIQLDLMSYTIDTPRGIWKLLLKQATLHDRQHFLVSQLEFAAVHLAVAQPLHLDPRLEANDPDNALHFPGMLKAYQEQVIDMRDIKIQILAYLEIHRPDTYREIIIGVGGEQGIGPLTIPQITTALREEIAGSNIRQTKIVKAELEATEIDTTQERPARHYRNCIAEFVTLLGEMGYVYAHPTFWRSSRRHG